MSGRGAFSAIRTGKAPESAVLALAAALVSLVLTSPALAVAPQTNISDVEDEVMCPICGTLLELAQSPQAQRQRVLVKRLIAAGKSKDQIKDALVAEYGREVLALPRGSGFDLSAYLVPAVAFLAAVAGLVFGVRRWRRAVEPPRGNAARASGPRGDDAERLDADLARYDL